MNAVFVAMWYEVGKDAGTLIGVAATFPLAMKLGLAHAEKLTVHWNKGLEEDEKVTVQTDKHGVAFLIDGDGTKVATCRIKEEIVLFDKPIKKCAACGMVHTVEQKVEKTQGV